MRKSYTKITTFKLPSQQYHYILFPFPTSLQKGALLPLLYGSEWNGMIHQYRIFFGIPRVYLTFDHFPPFLECWNSIIISFLKHSKMEENVMIYPYLIHSGFLSTPLLRNEQSSDESLWFFLLYFITFSEFLKVYKHISILFTF